MGSVEMYTDAMAGPPTPAFSQFVCNYTGSGVPLGAVTTHGFTTPSELFAEVVLAAEDFGQGIMNCVSNTITLDSITWKVGPVATGSTYEIPLVIAGGEAGQPFPPQVATLVSLSPAGVSNRFGGRFYMPPTIEEASNGGGVITGSVLAEYQTSIEGAYAAMAAVGSDPVIFSPTSSDPRDVDGISVQGRFGTQRRRNRR